MKAVLHTTTQMTRVETVYQSSVIQVTYYQLLESALHALITRDRRQMAEHVILRLAII